MEYLKEVPQYNIFVEACNLVDDIEIEKENVVLVNLIEKPDYEKEDDDLVSAACDDDQSKENHENDIVSVFEKMDLNQTFKCEKCEATYKKEGYLKAHMANKHNGIKYQCVYCEKEFASKKEQDIHIKNTHADVCKECKLCFDNKGWGWHYFIIVNSNLLNS